MTDFQMNDHILSKEAQGLARDIFDDIMRDARAEVAAGNLDDCDPEDWRDDMMDRAHEAADDHEWVIYTYKAIQICANCDVSDGEMFLEDCGGIERGETFGGIATKIAYGELRARIERELSEIIEEYEPEDDAESRGFDVGAAAAQSA